MLILGGGMSFAILALFFEISSSKYCKEARELRIQLGSTFKGSYQALRNELHELVIHF